ncbi:hypothetical protein HYH02_001316 [Chlamydomonas schloesseri]|uniref:F-box domain-containing protein n=1 Tax=Chlamydomonas schloesseri TaxID=2026947 RepID=A0A835WV49_9CHLO|nr:hypothetical protein HYH02_001316 [Chlamydomonas schloesseri]|eukprot:KAG2454285.1 hypothetical protein HYH02_001316 [Chlamydomonas schloesseri]
MKAPRAPDAHQDTRELWCPLSGPPDKLAANPDNWHKLTPELLRKVAAYVHPSEVASCLKLVCRDTAACLREDYSTIHLCQPTDAHQLNAPGSPARAVQPWPAREFVAHWGRAASWRALSLRQRQRLLCLAAASGDAASLDAALMHCGCCVTGAVLAAAAGGGCIPALERLLHYAGAHLLLHSAEAAAAEMGQLDTLQWLQQRQGPGSLHNDHDAWLRLVGAACRGRQIAVLDWLMAPEPMAAPEDGQEQQGLLLAEEELGQQGLGQPQEQLVQPLQPPVEPQQPPQAPGHLPQAAEPPQPLQQAQQQEQPLQQPLPEGQLEEAQWDDEEEEEEEEEVWEDDPHWMDEYTAGSIATLAAAYGCEALLERALPYVAPEALWWLLGRVAYGCRAAVLRGHFDSLVGRDLVAVMEAGLVAPLSGAAASPTADWREKAEFLMRRWEEAAGGAVAEEDKVVRWMPEHWGVSSEARMPPDYAQRLEMLRARGYAPDKDVAWAAAAQGDVRTLAWMLDSGLVRREKANKRALSTGGHPAALQLLRERGAVFSRQQVDLWDRSVSDAESLGLGEHVLDVTAWLSEAAVDLDWRSWQKLLLRATFCGGPLPLLRRLREQGGCGPVFLKALATSGCSVAALDWAAAHNLQLAGAILSAGQHQEVTCQDWFYMACKGDLAVLSWLSERGLVTPASLPSSEEVVRSVVCRIRFKQGASALSLLAVWRAQPGAAALSAEQEERIRAAMLGLHEDGGDEDTDEQESEDAEHEGEAGAVEEGAGVGAAEE